MWRLVAGFILALALSAAAAQNRITEDSVRALYGAVDHAVLQGDVDGYMGFFAPHATADVTTIDEVFGETRLQLSRIEIEVMARANLSMAPLLDIRTRILDIDIAADGQSARVASVSTQIARLGTSRITAMSEGVVQLELIGGEPRVVHLKGTTRISPGEGEI